MALDPTQFKALASQFAKIDLFGTAPPAPPWGTRATLAKVQTAIDSGKNHLPLIYQTEYVTPLEGNLQSLLQGPMEPWIAPIYEHAPNNVAEAQLGRFLAVVSNLYRSFLDKGKRAALDLLPLARTTPPLAFFQNSGGQGPYTITAEQVERFAGSSVGIVSLPSTYKDSPLLWAALAHETGGHDVLHADDGLLDELTEVVKGLFDATPVAAGGAINQRQLLGLLWSHWIDEAASDMYGILNIGPSFAANLAAFFAALISRLQSPPPFPTLGTESFPNPDRNNEIDEHPTDLLRLDLAIGAIQSLTGLSKATIDGYVADIRAIATLCAQGSTTVTLNGLLPVDQDHALPLNNVKIPLTQMQDAARKVGAAIVTAKLQTLKGHSIQEIETWDDRDEQVAQQLASDYLANASVAGKGDDAQLLAGATIAGLSRPDLYGQITKLLNAGLDDSFAKDPIWGRMRTDTAFMVSRFARLAKPAGAKSVKKVSRKAATSGK